MGVGARRDVRQHVQIAEHMGQLSPLIDWDHMTNQISALIPLLFLSGTTSYSSTSIRAVFAPPQHPLQITRTAAHM